MTPRFRKDFPTYEDATRWLHERKLSGVIRFVDTEGAVSLLDREVILTEAVPYDDTEEREPWWVQKSTRYVNG